MIFYDDNGDLIRDIRGLMLQLNAKALGFPQVPKLTHPSLFTGSANKDSDRGNVASCYVTQGTVTRNDRVRVIREGIVVFPAADQPGRLESLKRDNQDTAEIREGYECAITITGFDGFCVGDVIEVFRLDGSEIVEHLGRCVVRSTTKASDRD